MIIVWYCPETNEIKLLKTQFTPEERKSIKPAEPHFLTFGDVLKFEWIDLGEL